MNRAAGPSRILAAVLAAVMLTATAFAAVAVPVHTNEFYVNDFAQVLSDETERYIVEQSRAWDESNGTQLVVTTIPTLDGNAIEDYALEMARSWGIGGAEQDNGLLILLAVEDREVRVEIGYGLEGVINDAKAGRILRNDANPQFANGSWDAGMLALYNGIMAELGNPVAGEKDENEDSSIYAYGTLIAFLIVVLVVFASRKGGGPGTPPGGSGGGGGGHLYRGYRGGYYGGMGGGFRGGGGGMGGGARGGGGGFGGGGASGKF